MMKKHTPHPPDGAPQAGRATLLLFTFTFFTINFLKVKLLPNFPSSVDTEPALHHYTIMMQNCRLHTLSVSK
jgi:hypothetical protein